MSALTEQLEKNAAETTVGSVHCMEQDFTLLRETAPIDGVDRASYVAKDESGVRIARIGVGHSFAGRTRVGLELIKDEARSPDFLHEATSAALSHSGVEVAWFNPDTADIPLEVLDQAAKHEEADTGNYLFIAA